MSNICDIESITHIYDRKTAKTMRLACVTCMIDRVMRITDIEKPPAFYTVGGLGQYGLQVCFISVRNTNIVVFIIMQEFQRETKFTVVVLSGLKLLPSE